MGFRLQSLNCLDESICLSVFEITYSYDTNSRGQNTMVAGLWLRYIDDQAFTEDAELMLLCHYVYGWVISPIKRLVRTLWWRGVSLSMVETNFWSSVCPIAECFIVYKRSPVLTEFELWEDRCIHSETRRRVVKLAIYQILIIRSLNISLAPMWCVLFGYVEWLGECILRKITLTESGGSCIKADRQI